MDQKLYEIGLAKRRKVLGEAYVDRALQNVDDFNRDFQRLLTEYCWGETWGDETLAPRERSLINLGMIAALGKMEEFATHVRGALNNGLTPNEIRAALTQILIYCGAPIPSMLDKRAAEAAVKASGPPLDLQEHLRRLEADGLLLRIDRAIDKDSELHPLVRWQFQGGLRE